MRFLLSRRWLIFFVVVGLLAYGAWWLGQWQFDRLQQKHHDNARIQHNLAQPPVPVDALLKPGVERDKSVEWRRVTIHGHWDDSHTLVVKYQTDDNGDPGVRIATPLITPSGAAVLVERGWMGSSNNGDVRPSTPKPTAGDVTVTGWVRVSATGDATVIANASTRALSASSFARWVGSAYPVYGNPVDMEIQTPPPAVALGLVDMPDDTGDGPHFFYGLQWWFFGVLAVFGFCYLAYDERRRMLTTPE
ncbi:MAG: SURF1 family cytochrome oxidase biogenesis protein [Marmoricola sp.]